MPSSDEASALEAHLGFWLRFLSNHVSARFQRQLEAQGVSVAEWVALRTLWADEETGHARLIQALGMTKGATSKLVSRLEQKGLAHRRSDRADGREQSIVLSPSGRALVPLLAALADANDEYFFGHLGARQRQALMETLQGLVRHHRLESLPTA